MVSADTAVLARRSRDHFSGHPSFALQQLLAAVAGGPTGRVHHLAPSGEAAATGAAVAVLITDSFWAAVAGKGRKTGNSE